MKTNEFYKLNDNLDLEGYGVILKKDSVVSIKDIFNDDISEKPTILAVNALNIPGDFLMNAEYFQDSIAQNILEKSNPKFSVGDCVRTSSGKKGNVTKVISLDFAGFFYNVKLNSEEEYGYAEDVLQHC